jgi:hypothetical protein
MAKKRIDSSRWLECTQFWDVIAREVVIAVSPITTVNDGKKRSFSPPTANDNVTAEANVAVNRPILPRLRRQIAVIISALPVCLF